MIYYRSYGYTFCDHENRSDEEIDVQSETLPGLVRSLIGRFDLRKDSEVLVASAFSSNVAAFSTQDRSGNTYIFCIEKVEILDIDVSEFGSFKVKLV